MKILIAGGYGFIGSTVAERFYKEGNEIYIIDNLSSGDANNVKVKHKFYNLDTSDKKCEEIFKAITFDMVIYLAECGSINVLEEHPNLDECLSVSGLINILTLSTKFNIKKFLYLSSALVYSDKGSLPHIEEDIVDANSPYGILKTTGEMYCKKWSEIYNLNVVILRVSSAYGPKQKSIDGGNYICEFIERNISEDEVVVYGDGTQTKDYIYIEDVVDAIYKSMSSSFSGVLNISSNEQHSVNEILDLIKDEKPIKSVIYSKDKWWDIKNMQLDNNKAKKILNWNPKYPLKKGIKLTYKWWKEQLEQDKNKISKSNIKDEKKDVLFSSKYIPYIENMLGFLVLYFLTSKFSNSMYGDSNFNFSIVYIVLIAIVYGTRQAVISVILSTLLSIFNFLHLGGDIVSFIYEQKHIIQILMNIIVGLAIGYRIDKLNSDINSKDMEISSVKEKYNFLEIIYNETLIVKEELSEQILNSQDVFGKMYKITKELDKLDVEDIFQNAVDIIEEAMKTKTVAIYASGVNSKYLRLVSKSKDSNLNIKGSVKKLDYKNIIEEIKRDGIYINRNLEKGIPMFISPILDESGNDIAYVCVYNVEFNYITLYFENLFKIIVELVKSSLLKAYAYEIAINKERFIKDTRILNDNAFKTIYLSKKRLKEEKNIPYILVKVKSFTSFEELNYNALNVIRDTDYIGAINDGVYIILSNTKAKDYESIVKRLREGNIDTEFIDEGGLIE